MDRHLLHLGPVRNRLVLLFLALSGLPLLITGSFLAFATREGWVRIAPEYTSRIYLLGGLLVLGGFIAVAILLLFIERRLSRPLRAIRTRADDLGGCATARLSSDDEFVAATESLTLLADRIALVTGDLEDKVAERTRDLGRAMGELHLLKKLNDAIIHNIPSGIAILSSDARLLYLNAGFDEIWGISPSRLGLPLKQAGKGGPLGEINWRAQLAALLRADAPIENVQVETGTWPNRRVIRYSLYLLPEAELDLPLRLVGDEFCLAILAPPDCAEECENCFAHSKTWRGRHALLMIDDITEQHQLEAQLIQSEKLAALGQLSAGVAHEIRNPLSAISGAAYYIGDVLTDEEPDLSDIEEYVQLIQRNVDRAQRIVRDILNFARPSAGDGAACDLGELADQTLAILDKAMVDQGITLHRRIEPGILVECRSETVKQALLNLVVNGMQAMAEGGEMTVETVVQHDHAALVVSDTGCGISAENLSQIFNPFFTTKPAGQGTGLGLSIARQAIENDQGRLEVESKLGQGTTFRIRLPLAAEQAEPELAESSAVGD